MDFNNNNFIYMALVLRIKQLPVIAALCKLIGDHFVSLSGTFNGISAFINRNFRAIVFIAFKHVCYICVALN